MNSEWREAGGIVDSLKSILPQAKYAVVGSRPNRFLGVLNDAAKEGLGKALLVRERRNCAVAASIRACTCLRQRLNCSQWQAVRGCPDSHREVMSPCVLGAVSEKLFPYSASFKAATHW